MSKINPISATLPADGPGWIAEIAVRAMLLEAAATPKPGLVDLENSGAHADMNYFTFLRGTAALAPWMQRLAQRGWDHAGSLPALFAALRPLGRAAEKAMLRATGNVNTQRGLVFSVGLACGIAGRLARTEGCITAARLCRQMAASARGLCARELQGLPAAAPGRRLTPGERAFRRHGAAGVRGEIEKGLPLVRRQGLPALRLALRRGCTINDAALHALVGILEKIVDTTILHRHNPRVMRQAQSAARAILAAGSVFTEAGRRLLRNTGAEFTAQNISPGGAADLLALTLACHYWESEVKLQ